STDIYTLSLHDALPIWQAPLVPAGTVGPTARRSRHRLRHTRFELSHRIGDLGHARRQHPALRRHLERPRTAVTALRPPHHHAGRSEEHTSELQSLRHLV